MDRINLDDPVHPLEIKHDLAIRPIFHKTEARIEAHIFVAFLAYCLQLQQKKPVVFCGDLNVAHTELDLANPKPNRGKKGFTDAELLVIAGLTQLTHLEIGKMPLPDDRIPALKPFAFLKSLRLVPAKVPFTPEQQAKIRALLPQTKLEFK